MENVHRSAEQRPVARLPDSAGWTAQEQAVRGRKTAQKTSLPVGAGFVKQLNRPMVTIIGRFLCYALARQRPVLPCVKGGFGASQNGRSHSTPEGV